MTTTVPIVEAIDPFPAASMRRMGELPARLRTTVRRTAFTVLEVMIAVAILSTGLLAIISTLYSLNISKRATSEEATVQAVAQLLAERLQGARWDDLGKDVAAYPDRNAWSWHRRATPQKLFTPSPFNPPIEEFPTPSDPTRDLKALGLITAPTGVANLKVYLEYYQWGLIDHFNTLLTTNPNPKLAWQVECGNPITATPPSGTDISDPKVWLQEAPTAMDITIVDPSSKPAIVMRILVSWDSCVGGKRWHELVVTRRQ